MPLTTSELYQQTQQTRLIAEQRRQLAEQAQQRLRQQEQQTQQVQQGTTAEERELESVNESLKRIIEGGISSGEKGNYSNLVERVEQLSRNIALQKAGYSERAASEITSRRAPVELSKLSRFAQSIPKDPAVASASGGGVIRVRPDGSTYVDRGTTPQQAIREPSGRQSTPAITKQYEQAGFTKQEADILAQASEQQKRSFTSDEAKRILREVKTTGGYYSTAQVSSRGRPETYIGDAPIMQTGQLREPSFSERFGQALKQDTYGKVFTTLFPSKKIDPYLRDEFGNAIGTKNIPQNIPQRILKAYGEKYREAQKLLSKGGFVYTPEQRQALEIRLNMALASGLTYEELPEDLKHYSDVKWAGRATELGLLGGLTAPRPIVSILKNPLEVSGKVSYEPLRPTEAISGEGVYTIGKPLERISYTDPLTGKLVVQEKYNVLGLNKEVISEGRKTTLKANVGSRGRVIYEGIPTDTKGHKEALKYLQKQFKLKEKEAREVLRLQRPQIQESYFRGQGVLTIPEEGKTTFQLIGREKALPSKGQTGGVSWLQKEGRMNFLTSVGTEEGKFMRVVSEQERAYLRGGKYPYTKLRQQGKLRDSFEGLVGSTQVKEYPKGILYRELEVSRKTIPRARIPSVSTAKVLVEKGEPIWSITDETIFGRRGFMGGGKKSSQQFLEQLYKTDELTTSTILGLEKVKTTRPSIIKTPKTPQVLNVQIPKSEALVLLPRQEPRQTLNLPVKSELGQAWGQETRFGGVSSDLDRILGITKERGKERIGVRERSLVGLTPFALLKSFESLRVSQGVSQSQAQNQAQVQNQQQIQVQLLRKLLDIARNKTQKQREKPRKQKGRGGLGFLGIPFFKKESAEGWNVFVKFKGKDVKIKTAKTEKEAFNFLFGTLGRTLRAGGYVEQAGRKISPTSLPFMFRPAKRDRYRVIERRKYRLDIPSEVKEIQFFRKGERKFSWWK